MNPWIILAALTAVVGVVFVARAVRPRHGSIRTVTTTGGGQ